MMVFLVNIRIIRFHSKATIGLFQVQGANFELMKARDKQAQWK
jgi:hypothetical protein